MRINVGSMAPNFTVQALGGRTVWTWLPFAGARFCSSSTALPLPVNLHMHRLMNDYGKLRLGLTTVVYHSSADKLANENMELPPFDLVADPEKRVFKAYGVEKGLAGMFRPR